MSGTGADDEILEFAIAREIEANRFYLALAERVANPEIRKVFEDLAAEELEHGGYEDGEGAVDRGAGYYP